MTVKFYRIKDFCFYRRDGKNNDHGNSWVDRVETFGSVEMMDYGEYIAHKVVVRIRNSVVDW